MSNGDSQSEQLTNEQVIANAISSLKSDGKVDLELLEVLSKHIATLRPRETAVLDAARDIEALAEKRAAQSGDAHADHD